MELRYAGHALDHGNDFVLCSIDRLRAFLRSREVNGRRETFEDNAMSLESMIMLAVSVLTTVYLVYALLRPEKF